MLLRACDWLVGLSHMLSVLPLLCRFLSSVPGEATISECEHRTHRGRAPGRSPCWPAQQQMSLEPRHNQSAASALPVAWLSDGNLLNKRTAPLLYLTGATQHTRHPVCTIYTPCLLCLHLNEKC